MEKLLAGVAQFQSRIFPREQELFQEIAHEQHPRALFVTCCDSRVLPNLITQTRPGELFICRDIGNIVPAYGTVYGGVSATVEYAVSVLKVRHVIICGHSDCGAMRALLRPDKIKDLPNVYGWLSHAEAARRTVLENNPELNGDDLLWKLIEQNVISQLANLKTHPAVAARVARDDLSLHGWTYNIERGEVMVYDELQRRFLPVQGPPGNSSEAYHELSDAALLAR